MTAAAEQDPRPSRTSPAPAATPGPTAFALGRAGLVPFVAGALALWFADPASQATLAFALSAYAATIVAFLGGIHWGLGARAAVNGSARLVWGVVPSLVAWAALLLPPSAGLVVHGAALATCYAVDRRVFPVEGLAAWLPLRLQLTTIAAASCAASAGALLWR